MTSTSAGKRLAGSIALLALGLFTLIYQPYEYIFRKATIFYPNGITYGHWERPQMHLMLKGYLFNITNKDAFLAGKEKMKLEDVGPYVYREDAIHHNITFNHETGTVSSNPRYELHWVPEFNTRKETDKLFLPNIAMLLFVSRFSFLKLPINAFISHTNSSPIVELTVREFLFGYDDPFIKFGRTLLPFWITFEKMGILNRLYDHNGDVATTNTGELDRRMTGLIATYNQRPFLKHFDAPCNKMAGSSDGYKFGNNIPVGESLYIYRKGLCRAMTMTSASQKAINMQGVPSFLYKFDENMFDNGATDERNKCFCKTTPCLPKTIQDVSDCFFGFSVGLSFPHFFNGSEYLRERFEGLKPDANLHDTYGYVNLDAGYLTNGHIRLQVNALLDDLHGIAHCEPFSNMVLPLAWADFGLERIEPRLNLLLVLVVRVLPTLEIILAYTSILVGILMVVYQARRIIQCRYDISSARRKSNGTQIIELNAECPNESNPLRTLVENNDFKY